MTRKRDSQLRRLNRTLLTLYEETDSPQPLEAIADLSESLLSVTGITVDSLDLATGKVEHLSGRRLEHIPHLDEAITHYCNQNPLVAYALERRFAPALRISDFQTFRITTCSRHPSRIR